MSVKLDRMRTVEERLSADVIATSAAVKQDADRRALLYSLLLVAALVLAVVLALITARSLIRPLRRLETAAEETATRRLPGVVQRLQDGEPVDLQAESAPPIEVHSRDEIGHLAEAFNSVHRVAVRVAGREAALRRSVGDMFLNLARQLIVNPAEPPPPADGSAVRPADPDLDWVDSRVPMVHVPLGGHRPRSSP